MRTRAWPIEARRADDRHAAPDRRRPPPLRDRRRLPRGEPGGDAHVRDPRLVARARARDLPDAPARAGSSATSPASRSSGRTAASRSTATAAISRVATDDDFGPRVVESFAPEGVTLHRVRRRGDRGGRPRRRRGRVPARSRSRSSRSRAFAHAGETMPQKSTFFYPKLTSGLLFHPLVSRLARALPRRARRRRARARGAAGRAEREPVVGDGEGGDETTAIDAAAERVDPRALPRRGRPHRQRGGRRRRRRAAGRSSSTRSTAR